MSGFRAPGETGSGSKYRSTSTTSLPRSPTGMEPSNLPERKLGRSMRYSSSFTVTAFSILSFVSSHIFVTHLSVEQLEKSC